MQLLNFFNPCVSKSSSLAWERDRSVKKHDYLVLLSQPILLTSTLMMRTYQATPAELVSEIYIAMGTQICMKSKHIISTGKKLSLIVGRSEGQDRGEGKAKGLSICRPNLGWDGMLLYYGMLLYFLILRCFKDALAEMSTSYGIGLNTNKALVT